jgi:predicted PP-loop superfamily ATPase
LKKPGKSLAKAPQQNYLLKSSIISRGEVMPKVIVAMSGGVDSAVAAALLIRQGSTWKVKPSALHATGWIKKDSKPLSRLPGS